RVCGAGPRRGPAGAVSLSYTDCVVSATLNSAEADVVCGCAAAAGPVRARAASSGKKLIGILFLC
ncbi:MAG: hypothetical protein UHU21_07360, partial [Lachnospiraceae bacterium]|nr:hypothetical protein [Lachnospiraceae bacterium]